MSLTTSAKVLNTQQIVVAIFPRTLTFSNKIQWQNKNNPQLNTLHWTWDSPLVLHSRKHFFFGKSFAIYFLFSQIPVHCSFFVHTNISDQWQGEICNWKVNNCRHIKKDWLWKAKQNREHLVSRKNIMWIPYNLLSVPRVNIVWNKVVGLIRALALNKRFSNFRV